MQLIFRTALLAATTLVICTWAFDDTVHLTNRPDSPEFSLTNLARVANSILDSKRGNRRYSSLTNPYARNPRCDAQSVHRTIDGTCNNIENPWRGAAKTPLARVTQNRYEDGFDAPRRTYYHSAGVLPTARQISVNIFMTSSNESNRNTHLLMNYGQFLAHDFTLSPEAGGEGGTDAVNKDECCSSSRSHHVGNLKECFPIPTPRDHVLRVDCMAFLRSSPVPGLPGSTNIRYQMNDLTAYIDGSQVYGNTNRKASALRKFVGGRLKTSTIRSEESLPTDSGSSCSSRRSACPFAAGDVRSGEQAGLSSMHTLFLREHNRIARELEKINRHWDDETLYQTARKILGAVLQRITYKEFLPEVLGPQIMSKYGLYVQDQGRFYGYSSKVDASIVTEFSTAAFRFGHSLVRQRFSTSHFHSVDLREMFEASQTIHIFGSNALLNGLSRDRMERSDNIASRGLRDELFGDPEDLVSFNINRGRDHGVGSYNDIRRKYRLPVARSYNDMIGRTHSLSAVNDFKRVYPSPEDLELFPAGVSELPMSGAVVGETFGNVIGQQFNKLKYGDRFWHETPTVNIGFTTEQLQEIRKASFSRLFCDNVHGAQVRRYLLQVESYRNPSVSCSSVASMDLTKWRESQPQSQPPRRTEPVNRFRSPAPQRFGTIDSSRANLRRRQQLRQQRQQLFQRRRG